jgi:hypothetical protein
VRKEGLSGIQLSPIFYAVPFGGIGIALLIVSTSCKVMHNLLFLSGSKEEINSNL